MEHCHTTVEAAFVWAGLVLVADIGAPVLVQIARIVVPASVAAQANVAE
jgi:hypothetical protein